MEIPILMLMLIILSEWTWLIINVFLSRIELYFLKETYGSMAPYVENVAPHQKK